MHRKQKDSASGTPRRPVAGRARPARRTAALWAQVALGIAFVLGSLKLAAAENPPPEGDFARSRLHLADELLRETKYEEALALYREIEDRQPNHPKALRGVKNCLMELKRYDELRELLVEELAHTPDHPAVFEELGTIAARQGNRDEALGWWKKILQSQDGTRGSYAFVADLLLRNRMLDEALEVYAEADSLYPTEFTRQKASLHELRFEFDDATHEYLEFLETSPTALSYVEGRLLRIGESEEGLGPTIARVEAWAARRKGEMGGPSASGEAHRATEVVLRKLLGDLYLEAHNHEKAQRQYFRLVDDAPNQFSALLVFGKRCQSDGEHEVAIRVFEKIVADFPDARVAPSALSEIASSQTRLARWDEALATYARLIEDYPETDFALSARYETAKILREGKREPDRAEEIFVELTRLRQGPWGQAGVQFEIAECAVWRGDLERARGIYAAVRARDFSEDTKERALFEEARALFYQGAFAQADTLFKQVATQYPKGPHVNDALGFSILLNTNTDGPEILSKYAGAQLALRVLDPKTALAALSELEEKHPTAAIHDETLLLLGEAHRDNGDPEQALLALERAVAEAQVMDLAADARLLRAQIFSETLKDPTRALAEYEELLLTYPETLAADRARDLAADLRRILP